MSEVESWGAQAPAWNYHASVAKVRPMVIKWRTLTVEIVEELYQAREAIDGRGKNRGKENVPNGTFSQYLKDVGLARTTVHRWLERYVPEERKVLTEEEYEQRKQIEDRAKMDAATAATKKAIQFEGTGEKPADWDQRAEQAYQRRRKEEAERSRRLKKLEQDMAEKKRQREEEQERREWERIRDEVENDLLTEAASRASERSNQKRAFKDRIRLSQSGQNNQFIEALMEYLEELPDDNRRLEACNDIIKTVRAIAVQLHGKSVKEAV